MQSTPNLRDTDPHDMFVIEPDVSLAARQEDRRDKAPLDLLYDVLSHPSAPRPSDPAPAQVRPDPELRIAPDFSASAAVPADTRATTADDDVRPSDIKLGETEITAHQPRTSKFARGVVLSLFAVGSAMGAAAWQHYGDDAKAAMARYAPPFALAAFASPEKATATEPVAVADQAPAADQAAAASAPAAATTAPDQTQVIQSMARDLAAMGQQISELKASIEQLKATQQQAAVAPARTAEALPKTAEVKPAEPAAALVRPKIVPPPPRSTVATLARRPKQVFPYAPIAPASPPQQAAAPVQIAPPPQVAEDGGPVVRPPLALH